jgi:DNA repair protein RadD
MNLWPHQQRAVEELPDLLVPGSRVVTTAPTGGGKSLIVEEMIREFGSFTLYTNRKMLLEQLAERLRKASIPHGILAAGHKPDFNQPVQLASIQTMLARSVKRTLWDIPRSRVVGIDEAHLNAGGSMQALVDQHMRYGAACWGITATPLDIGHFYNHLHVAGTVSELRACGALVPAIHYAPDEPDTRGLKRTKTGEYAERDVVKKIMSATIIGRVIDNYFKLNKQQSPTVLFAPGVKESLWFCEELNKAGIPAAHIDGDRVSMDGEHYVSSHEAREEVRDRLQDGRLKVVCNRFVLREGIDWPFVQHLIFATIFGSLGSYLQSGGRGLRACPSVGKEHVTIQDHGGNWHRQGSLNSDREWNLSDTNYMVSELREQRMKKKEEREPITCPKCHMVRLSGSGCPGCGLASSIKTRMVVQKDGSLKAQTGDIYRMPVVDRGPRETIEKRWESCYWSCKKKGETFRQAYGLYHYRHDWKAPPEGLPLMPQNERDWFLPIKDVPMERLVPRVVRVTTEAV